MSWKAQVRNWTPPPLLKRLSKASSGNIYQDGGYCNWDEAKAVCTGYDAKHVLDKVLAATQAVKNGEYAYERDSILFEKSDYNWPLLCALLAASSQDQGTLSVLDFGGALGSSYFQHRSYLNSIAKLDWNVIEQAHYVAAGKSYIQEDQLSFYPSVEECLKEKCPNVILLSSVLQYLPKPSICLQSVSASGAKILFIDRTPFTHVESERIITQHVPQKIYDASYPMWLFGDDFISIALTDNWKLKSTHLCPEGTTHTNKGAAFTYKGFTFELS